MTESNSSVRQPHQLSWLVLVVAVGFIVSACVSITTDGGTDAAATPSSSAPSLAPTETVVPTRVPGVTRVGYISLDEGVPFAQSVSESVRSAATAAGVELVECDSGLTPQGALDCGAQLGAAGVDGLISFQGFPAIAADICDATGNVPTVGIAFDQGPCEVSRLRLDQLESGRIAGEAMGRFAADRWDCKIDAYVSLEASAAGADATDRMAGYREGFERHCPIPSKADVTLDGADRVATAQARFARTLRQRRGDKLVVVGLNEDAIAGAMDAADAAGRTRDVFYSGQGADPSVRLHIACDRQYVASVAHFPERYGDLALPALLDAIAGEPVPELLEGPMELVTAEDIRDHYPDIPACDG
jgi:ribose transport system substrate-binding protein